jgi:hypothetical protein
MDRRHMAILIVSLMIPLILLSGCVQVPVATGPVATESLHDTVSSQDRDTGQNTHWWISVDPLPNISGSRNLRISGASNLPEGTELNYHVLLASRNGANGTFGSNYGDFSGSTDVSMVPGSGAWSIAIDLDPSMPGRDSIAAEQCIVHVSAIRQNAYATSVAPVSQPPLENIPYQIRLIAPRDANLHHPFMLNGATNLPAGTLLAAEIYPGVFSADRDGPVFRYEPLLQEFVTVGVTGEGRFSVPVNLTGLTGQDGSPLSSGEYFAEIHDVNTNSTLSDTLVFFVSRKKPEIHIDPINEPVKGGNLTITGTTSLNPGENVSVVFGTMVHPCPTSRTTPDYDTQSICGGSSCSSFRSVVTVVVQPGTDTKNIWKYEIGTSNWCLKEQYFVQATAGKDGSGSEASATFSLHEAG